MLDLMGNKIGKVGCNFLSTMLSKKECRIETLNLENNQLGDSNCQTVI